MPADQHQPNSWQSYLSAHQGRLRDFQDHFLVEDGLAYDLLPAGVRWHGVLRCLDGIEIHVERYQASTFRKGARRVQTVLYKYHVIHRHQGRADEVVRYDNVHTQPGHPDAHHRHRFDADGVEIEPPEHVGRRGWPNLGQVLDEAYLHWRTCGVPGST